MIRKYDFIPLEWDTKYFGVNSARLNLWDIPDEKEQDEIAKLCAEYDFVTISNIGNLKENNQWIGSWTNTFLADMNIQFAKDLYEKPSTKDENTFVMNHFPRNNQLLQIASESFRYSRFFNDPKLPTAKAKNIYQHWTDCGFGKENKYFVICNRKENIAGYILFSYTGNSSVIELFAVDEKYQGQKVGKSLIETMESFVIDQRIIKVKVGTQLDNIQAAKFYFNLGFSFVSCGSVYHMWNR